jgi:DNA-binding CsgD family transcriptional regulator
MSSESDLATLIAAIYEAGMDFNLWPLALKRIASAFGVPSASMARQGRIPSECWGFAVGIDPSMSENYLKYYYGVDPLWQTAISTPAGTVQSDTMLIPRREFVRTEFFNDFLMPQSIAGLLNAIVLVEEGRQSVVTLHGDQQFDEGHVALYKLLAPHLQRAVQINLKLARTELNQAASVEALNRLDQGILFLDVNARIIFANAYAEMCFVPDAGLRQRNGILRSNSPSETAALHAVIAKCGDGGPLASGGFLSFSRGDGRLALSLMIAPVPYRSPDWLIGERPVAIVSVTDPERIQQPASRQLQYQFGFTRAQAAFAVEILKGDGIQAAADRLSISRATARTHLSRIFDKTGARRQSELVRLLMSAKLSMHREHL